MDSMRNRLRFYGQNTTLHGLCYVADEKRPIPIRIFWLFIWIISFIGMLKAFRNSYDSYRDNAISFATETTYLDWNTTFPAVTVCEITMSEVSWNEGPIEDRPAILQLLPDIIFFTGSCYSCTITCETCDKINFRDVVKKYRKPCTSLLSKCYWNDVVFDCCDRFLPVDTEYGTCFSFNSFHTHSHSKDLENHLMKSNKETGPGKLLIETLDDVRLYFHAPEDVPFINSNPDHRKDIMFGEVYNISFNVIQIENDENVKYLPVDKRTCRFPWEKTDGLHVHEFYSYSTCVVQCHADAHLRLCNCTHHLMPVLGQEHFCDIKGLQCLTDNYETVNRLHAKGFDKPGLVCDCVPSCVEPEYKVVSDNKGIRGSYSEVLLKMQALPTFRFKRNVVRTTMDLVVSIGGTAGLFIGASLLSIMETIYLFFLRK